MRRVNRIAWAVALVAGAAAGCKEEKPLQVGTQVVSSPVKQLWSSPSGGHVATLAEAVPSKEKDAPADAIVGALTLVPAAGGEARRLGGGVTNMPGSLLFSADGGAVAFLASYSFTRAKGELRLAKTAGGEAEALADEVTFFDFTRDGQAILWVANNELFRRAVAGGEVERLLPDVQQFELGPAKSATANVALVKRPVSKARELVLLDLGTKQVTPVARGAGAYAFSPRGDRYTFTAESTLDAAGKVADTGPLTARALYVGGPGQPARRVSDIGAASFAFSPAGDRFAWLTPPTGKADTGDLWVADGAEPPKRIAVRVSSIRFAPDGSLGLLASYDRQSSAGTLGILPPQGAVREVARNVKQFEFTPKGGHLLFSQIQASSGSFSLLLGTYPVPGTEDTKARTIDRNVFGYLASPDEKQLAYKHKCTHDAKSCALSVASLGSEEKPRELTSGVAAFEYVPDGSGLLVITTRRAGKNTARLLYAFGTISATEPEARLRYFDEDMSGEYALLGEKGERVVWLVEDPKRAGVYVADRSAATNRQ